MFSYLFKEEKFLKDYIEIFISRFTNGSLSIENDKISVSSLTRVEELYNNMNAIKYLFEYIGDKLYPHHIQKVAELVNENIKFLSKGYRRTTVVVNGANFDTAPACEIHMRMLCLFDNYHNVWTYRDIFEKEALFHIDFIRIHPFEDGNGRTSRIIMNYNLCKTNNAPVIICPEDRQKYFDFIGKADVAGLAKFLEAASLEELNVMKYLYQRINQDQEYSEKLTIKKLS